VTRADFQRLAEERILAAQALLAANLWSSAYYLAGYAVECGLKSCILVRVAAEPGIIFDERRYSERCWSHGAEVLLELAGLEATLNAARAANPLFSGNWLIVTGWSEQSRYEQKTQAEAQELYDAITDPPNGVMSWIRVRW
jgi:hypothetical protein